MNEETKQNEKAPFEDRMKNFLNGDALREFLLKHVKTIVLVAIVLFAYIGNRYSCERLLSKIITTQQAIKEVKYEILSTSSEIMEMSRQSSLDAILTEKGEDIKISVVPPVKID